MRFASWTPLPPAPARQIKNRFPGWKAAHVDRDKTGGQNVAAQSRFPTQALSTQVLRVAPPRARLSVRPPLATLLYIPRNLQGINRPDLPASIRTGGPGKCLPPDRRGTGRCSDPAARPDRRGRPGSRVSRGTSSRLFPWGEVQGCGRGTAPPG